MRIVVVEDDVLKLKRIVSCLVSVPGMHLGDIEECRYSSDARRRLRQRKFELLLIDINIPDQLDEDPKIDGGIRLLEEIAESEIYSVPDHIMGITAYEEVYEIAEKAFSQRNWHVVYYRAESEEWEQQIRNKVEHISAVVRSIGNVVGEYQSELPVICALEDPELKAVRSLSWSWSRVVVPNDHGIYFEGTFPSQRSDGRVVAASPPRMGMAAAAILATKMLYCFRPRFVVMVGIAGGVRGVVNLGDVVVADDCWDYGSGKFDVSRGRGRFRVAPHQIGLSAESRAQLVSLAGESAWLNTVRSSWAAGPPAEELRIRLGPIASGAAVLADQKVLDGILAQNRKTLAIDMEAYGVLAAAEEGPAPKAVGIIIKSVSDFADESKSDSIQAYAAFTCCQVLARFAADYL